jgi:hypothetical protein
MQNLKALIAAKRLQHEKAVKKLKDQIADHPVIRKRIASDWDHWKRISKITTQQIDSNPVTYEDIEGYHVDHEYRKQNGNTRFDYNSTETEIIIVALDAENMQQIKKRLEL